MARQKRPTDARPECEWTLADEDASHWEGTCGVAWYVPEGTPKDNGMHYCPRCGGRLKQQ